MRHKTHDEKDDARDKTQALEGEDESWQSHNSLAWWALSLEHSFGHTDLPCPQTQMNSG